ncbi:chemotaxis protein CheW [Aquabacter spiritensis]|uniref:Chemotaxis protein CheW n=1 Tax=Aquabacter spiritensis TaxID=933073 RepID=A0A4R3LQ89_9HYPH|nr:chemotaxis protein CheW [Aquabacter spiritensis]TCT01729.1 CheW protein [Aquabacter spiritensis]
MADPAPDAPGPGGRRRFLTFRSDARLYALPVEKVRAIVPVPPVARVPMAPPSLLGIGNLRGAAVPVVSLRALLAGGREGVAAGIALVLDGGAPVALAVDRVEGLVTVAAGDIETRTARLAALPGEQLDGAFGAGTGDTAPLAKILDIAGLIGNAFTQRTLERSRPPAGTRPAAAEPVQATVQRARMITFEVASQDYALSLADAREVVPAPKHLTRLPHAEALVLGMMAHRGTLLPLFSLRGLLGLPQSEPSDGAKVVVTRVRGATVGLLVDRLRDVMPVDPTLLEPMPAALAARTGGETRIGSIYRAEAGRRLILVLTPETLFGEDVMQRLAMETGSGPSAAEAEPVAPLHVVVFRLGDDEFGLPVACVEEVAAVPERLTRVPRTPAFLEGVVNLRGEVLPVIDQRRRFGMPALETAAGRRLVVVRTARHRAGLIVDSVVQVLRSSQDRIAPAPDLAGEDNRLVHGVVNLPAEGRMVLLLDPQELLTRTEQGLLEAFAARKKPVRG